MQFGDINAAPLSVEDRPDRVVRRLAVSKVPNGAIQMLLL